MSVQWNVRFGWEGVRMVWGGLRVGFIDDTTAWWCDTAQPTNDKHSTAL